MEQNFHCSVFMKWLQLFPFGLATLIFCCYFLFLPNVSVKGEAFRLTLHGEE